MIDSLFQITNYVLTLFGLCHSIKENSPFKNLVLDIIHRVHVVWDEVWTT
jgi:hypothetical protein